MARDILKIALEMNLKKVNGEGLGTTFMGCPIYITPCVPEGSVLMHPKDYVKYLHELIYR